MTPLLLQLPRGLSLEEYQGSQGNVQSSLGIFEAEAKRQPG